MPLVRNSLIKGKSPAYVRSVADAAHRALHETYEVPADDRFLVIEELDRHALIYGTDYLGIHRTDDIVIIHVRPHFQSSWNFRSPARIGSAIQFSRGARGQAQRGS